MPGGGGGGIAGMLMHGIGGGPGGGMGGMGGMMGGGQQNSSSQSQTEQTKVTDEYDVDRWKRADGPDAPIVAHEAGGETPYMDGLRESEERQKYSVRIPR